jgi:hypothetical protein
MAVRGGETLCPACARGAVRPEGTWATLPPRRRRRRRTRTDRGVVRPPTHGASTADRPDTIFAGLSAGSQLIGRGRQPGWKRPGLSTAPGGAAVPPVHPDPVAAARRGKMDRRALARKPQLLPKGM